MTLEQALNHIITLYGEKILDDSNFCQRELGNAGFDDSSLEARLLFVLLDKNAVSEIRQMIQQNQGITKYSLAIKAYAKMFADETVSNEYQTIFLEHIQMLIDLFSDEGIVESLYPNHKDIMPVDNFESALEKLISDYGVSVLAAPARARAILNDLSGNMLKEESLEFEELLRKLNDGSTVFQGADDKRFLESLWQVLKNHNMKYEPLERYDAWQEEKRNAPPAPEQEKNEKNTYEYGDVIRWLLQAAIQGDANAQRMVGVVYYSGEGVTQNYEKAARWLQKAAEQGDVNAQFLLGGMYLKGEGVTQNYEEAAQWVQKAAEQGYADAQFVLGVMYRSGEGVTQNYEEAAQWVQKAAEQGYAKAQYKLGDMYYSGEGVTQDYGEAMMWYRLAAKQGNANAQCNLGYMYYKGEGVAKNYGEAAMWYQKAAEQGNACAQFHLGLMYDSGVGGSQNYEEAARWYTKAAEQGYAAAQNNLGVMYYNGKGVPANYKEAVRWFRKAEKQGNSNAQDNLRMMHYVDGYMDSDFIPPTSQSNIDVMYGNGEGVDIDYDEAEKYFLKAAEQGDQVAINALEKVQALKQQLGK